MVPCIFILSKYKITKYVDQRTIRLFVDSILSSVVCEFFPDLSILDVCGWGIEYNDDDEQITSTECAILLFGR
jgi:hypothetical protein